MKSTCSSQLPIVDSSYPYKLGYSPRPQSPPSIKALVTAVYRLGMYSQTQRPGQKRPRQWLTVDRRIPASSEAIAEPTNDRLLHNSVPCLSCLDCTLSFFFLFLFSFFFLFSSLLMDTPFYFIPSLAILIHIFSPFLCCVSCLSCTLRLAFQPICKP